MEIRISASNRKNETMSGKKINISDETRDIERNKAAYEAIQILRAWANSDSSTDQAVKNQIEILSDAIGVKNPDELKIGKVRYIKKTGLVKWLISNINKVILDLEETTITPKELASIIGVDSCTSAVTALQGESFQSKEGNIYSIVASCNYDPSENLNGALGFYSRYTNWEWQPQNKEKGGMDSSSMRIEWDDDDYEIIRIRKHTKKPFSYFHWDEETANHIEMRARMAGKNLAGGRKFFQMQAASQVISDYAKTTTPTRKTA
jgi:hypothetical protein